MAPDNEYGNRFMDKMSYIYITFHPKDVRYQITGELGDPKKELENGARKTDSGEWRSQQSWGGGGGERGGEQGLE
jgi:hypothetical protein